MGRWDYWEEGGMGRWDYWEEGGVGRCGCWEDFKEEGIGYGVGGAVGVTIFQEGGNRVWSGIGSWRREELEEGGARLF